MFAYLSTVALGDVYIPPYRKSGTTEAGSILFHCLLDDVFNVDLFHKGTGLRICSRIIDIVRERKSAEVQVTLFSILKRDCTEIT